MKFSKTSLGLAVSMLIGASLSQNTFANPTNNVGRLAAIVDSRQVPAEATQSEAVAAASLGSNSIINNSGNYQPVNTKPRIFGEQLFRGAFSTTSGSTFNDSYVMYAEKNGQKYLVN